MKSAYWNKHVDKLLYFLVTVFISSASDITVRLRGVVK